MDTTDPTHAFTQACTREGFTELVEVESEAHGTWDTHTHPFEAKALILAGEIRIRIGDGAERTYRAGDIFHLQHEEPHAEWYGPEGVRYLVARRSSAG